MVKNRCKYFALLALYLCCVSTSIAETTPKPKLKPGNLRVAQPAELTFPSAGMLSGWPTSVLKVERAECLRRLKGLNVSFKTLAPIGGNNACGAAAPLDVNEIAGVAITPPGTFTCGLIEALHGWIASSVVPAAKQHLNKQVVGIHNASAYVCRRRNGLASGKLSEHAKANALDIATLDFDDSSSINIKGDWSGIRQLVGASAKGNFLKQIRRESCIHFTTVLGPGSDRYHGDHFHVDVARRKNGYRICN